MTAEELGRAIFEGRGTQALPAYLAAGGSVDAVDPNSRMPMLHLACEHQDLEMIRALVEAGADLNLRDAFGHTPLHIAVDNDTDAVAQAGGDAEDIRYETTILLLQLGADRDIRDNAGRTPRDLAALAGRVPLERFDRLTSSISGPPPG
ncbi:hypothetical protein BH23PLA1_BH23PLA1_22020 [soil metagenome]